MVILLKLQRLQKHVSPDVTAQIFWLKNRKPEQWRDKPSTENSAVIDKLDEVLNSIDGKI